MIRFALTTLLATSLATGCRSVRIVPKLPIAAARSTSATPRTGEAVQLDGTASTPAEAGRALAFRWHFAEAPTGSTAAFVDATQARPSFTPRLAGHYLASLVVDDGANESAPATVAVDVASGAPTAVIAPLAATNAGSPIALDGSSSTDPAGHALAYRWTLSSAPAGSAAHIAEMTAVKTSLVADAAGTYVVSLVVDDGPYGNASAAAQASLTVGDGQPTAAIVTPLGPANAGTPVVLSVDLDRTHQPDGHPLSYRWDFVALPPGSRARIDSPTAAQTSFVPDVSGVYTVSLVADDGRYHNISPTAAASVTVGDGQPLAKIATPLGPANTGTPVVLDGSASAQPDHHPLGFHWAFSTLPAGSAARISEPGAAVTSFIPDRNGAYAVRLVVEDGRFGNVSAAAAAALTVGDGRPVAKIAVLASPNTGTPLVLDGSASTSPDGHPLSFRWSLASVPAGSAASIAAPNAAVATFTPDVSGAYAVSLVVDDGAFGNVSAAALASATVGSGKPTAKIATLANPRTGTPVSLDGAGSTQPDGHALSFRWSFVSTPAGSAAQIAAPGAATTSFTPDVSGAYTVMLAVTDGTNAATGTATSNVGSGKPTAKIAALANPNTGTPVALDGAGSTQPDGHPLTFNWSFVSAPAGSAAAIAAPTAARTSFTPDVKGSYTVMLTVTDGLNAATATASSAVGSGKATLSAGPNQNADAGDLVPMSPTLVANPDGHALSFSWEIVSTAPGSVATLRPANSFAPTLSDLTTPGGYTLRLHATDAYGNVADPSETTVNVKDPQAWVRPTSPVLSASGTGFDCGGVESPSVIRDPSGASFVMFYSGHTCGADSPSSTPWSIGRATGADEVTWTRAGAALPHGLGEAHPTLLVDGAKLKLWFARRESRNCGGGGHAYFWRIAYSETTDLTGASGWSAPQLALGRGDPGNPDWDSGDVLAPFVIKVGGLYRMYYSGDTLVGGGGFGGCGGGNREDGVGDYQIGLATSLDGLNWQKLPPGAGTGTNPVVAGNGTTLQVGGAAGLLDNFQLKLWMAPFPFGAAGGQFQIAYAASATPADWPQAALLPLALDGGAGWDAGYVNNPTLDKSLSLAPSSQIPLYKMWYAGSITPGISQNSLQNASASIGYARRGELQ